MREKTGRWFVIGILLGLLMPGLLGAEPAAGELRMATFQCDVTPPIGHWLYVSEIETIEHPLLAKGVLLEQGDRRFVLAAIDWCVLSGQARTLLRAGSPASSCSVS
ncbi:MAG: hypothetical protein ACQESR_00855 [Planctomycetota bacterium]